MNVPVPPPPRMRPLLQATVPLLVNVQFGRSWSAGPVTYKVLLAARVTNWALFQFPACHCNAPRITLVPTRLPEFSQVLVPLTVPFKVKLPEDKTVNPNALVVI